MTGLPSLAALGRLRPLFGELNDLKRIRSADSPRSLAEQGFVAAWSDLLADAEARDVALATTGRALAAARLGGIDVGVLRRGGLDAAASNQIMSDAIREVAQDVDPALLGAATRAAMPSPPHGDRDQPLPRFVERLVRQPRAGATRPGRPRLVLEPPESHAEHCYVTAVYAVLVAPLFGADPAVPFLAGLSHHFHNAELPDSGFAGEELLGRHLRPIMDRFTDEALAQLPRPLAGRVRDARAVLEHADTPEARAFHAGDVLDRVLQMEQYARVAAFELCQALDDLDLVHPGPLLAFQNQVLDAAGLRP